MNDWMDKGWLEFEDNMLEGDELDKQRRLLKEAWLHGARTAMKKAQEVAHEDVLRSLGDARPRDRCAAPLRSSRTKNCILPAGHDGEHEFPKYAE